MIDYKMSEKFGLDWKKKRSKRMNEFIMIMSIENKLNKPKNNGSRKLSNNSGNRRKRS